MIDIIKLDPKETYNAVIASMEAQLGEIINPGDERRIVVSCLLAPIISLSEQANAFANAQLVNHSYGAWLDELGKLVGAKRLDAGFSKTTLRFTVSAPAGTVVTIPKGTRATPDGSTYFATDSAVAVSYDTPTVDVEATALTAGESCNNIAIDAVNVIVDPVAYLTSVSNITITSGGTDIESDDAFRERIRMAPSQSSVAGPANAYKYFAMSTNSEIGDVSVTRPAAKQVLVTALMKDGSLPSQTLLDEILAVLSADTVRPLTDEVMVQAPTEMEYTAIATYYISADDASQAGAIQTAVSAAFSEYLSWQSEKLGRAINPDELRQRLKAAGACYIELTSPTYTTVEQTAVARPSKDSALTYGGIIS